MTLPFVGLWKAYDPPHEKPLEELAASGLDFFGIEDPFDVDLMARRGIRAEIDMGQHLGEFVVYTEISNTTTQELFGLESDSVSVDREAELVSRMYLPGVEVVDAESSSDGSVYVTQYDMSGNDIGINVEESQFEMLRPETGHESGGTNRCSNKAGDPGYTGCIFGVPFDDNVLSRIPIAGANSDWSAQNVAMNILSEFGNPNDPCFWKQVLIPKMNQVYVDNGINYQIDGDAQIDEAGKMWIRFFIRNKLQDIPADKVEVNLRGTYSAAEPLHMRVENVIKLSGGADTVIDLSANADDDFCVTKGENYTGSILSLFEYGEKMDNVINRAALAGMENPPPNVNTATGEIEEGVEEK